MTPAPVAGVLLTGGASRRMGVDKATLVVRGVPLAVRLGEILAAATHPAIEVGPGRSGLPAAPDHEPGAGPLVAVATAAARLADLGWQGPAVVLACDLPLLTGAVVRLLAGWPGDGAVVPLVDGRHQPLCARWAATDLEAAARRAAEGQRSLRGFPGTSGCTVLTEADWGAVAPAGVFADADSPDDLARLGLTGTLVSQLEEPGTQLS